MLLQTFIPLSSGSDPKEAPLPAGTSVRPRTENVGCSRVQVSRFSQILQGTRTPLNLLLLHQQKAEAFKTSLSQKH